MDVAEPRSRVSDLHRRAIPRGLSSLRGRSVMKSRSKRHFLKRKKERKKNERDITGFLLFRTTDSVRVARVIRYICVCACVCAWVCVCVWNAVVDVPRSENLRIFS